jgi:KDO2-lipid IV(A) lauroyltransferase
MLRKLWYHFAFYGFLLPVAHLPLLVLYRFSDLGYVVFRFVIRYRKKVIAENLRNAFPEKTQDERDKIQAKFYRHLCDVLIEGLHAIAISRRSLNKRMKIKNPEVIARYKNTGMQVVLVGGHYNNWEYLVLGMDVFFGIKGVGVGKNLSNDIMHKLLNQRRTRYGMEVWDASNVREHFEQFAKEKKEMVCLLLADQSVNNISNAYWMEFLNQATPVIFGPEYLSAKYALPVVFFRTRKTKRGYFEIELEEISQDGSKEKYGDITFRHHQLLEALILEKPEYWLWSHKRWKHKHKAPEVYRKA